MKLDAWLLPDWPTPEGWTAIFTGLLFAATCFLGWFTFKLWKETRKAVGDTEVSLAISQKAADAAKRSADAATGVELPRLRVQSVWRRGNGTAIDQIMGGRIIVKFWNYGRTPAHIIEIAVAVSLREDFDRQVGYPPGAASGASLGSVALGNAEWIIESPQAWPIPRALAEEVWDGTAPYYVFGYVIYRDFLDQLWRSKFCVVGGQTPIGERFSEIWIHPSYAGHERFDRNRKRTDLLPGPLSPNMYYKVTAPGAPTGS